MEAQTPDLMNGKATVHAESHTKFEGYVSHTGESFKAENLEDFYVKVANRIPLNLEAIGVEHPDDWEHKPIGHGKRFYYWMVKLKETNELGKDYDYYLRGERSGTLGLGLGLPEKVEFIASCGAEDKKNWYDDVLTNEEHLTHGYLEITKVAKSAVTPHTHIFAIGDRVRANGQTQFYRIDENSSGTIIALDHGPCNNLIEIRWDVNDAIGRAIRTLFRYHQVVPLSAPTPVASVVASRKRVAPTPDDVVPDVALGGDSARKRAKTVLEVPVAEVRRHPHSSRVSEYHYLRIRDVAEFNEQVTKMMKDGWQPYYGPCSEKFFINQAMVKYE